jgi:Xaa-Pro aminopeptidase
VADKLGAVREKMTEEEVAVLILTKLDEIAWLTNLRGSDVSYNPVFESYCVIEPERATCFTRLTPEPEIQAALAPEMSFAPYEAYTETLLRISASMDGKIWLDPAGTTMGTRLLLPEGRHVHEKRNPVVLMKALKNEVELARSRQAHERAAAAKIRSLARMERLHAAGQLVSEKAYAQMLRDEYAREDGFRDLSFATISAVGANGAIVHYGGANDEVALQDGELLLVDSGTQMGAGTTDDTRTICIGTPTQRQQQLYTLVLRCHIQLARQKFPEGTGGVALDALTRGQMWNAGLDYGHGTGHGVGALLNVHEGPQRVASRGSDEPLQPGMIISNEPGYYEAGWGGIRLENLYVVTGDETLPAHPNGKKWLQLETLTLIPFDHRLIDWAQLSQTDRSWLAAYHRQVLDTIGPLLSDDDRAWLQAACEPFV